MPTTAILVAISLLVFAFFGFLLLAVILSYEKKKRDEEKARDQAYKKAVVILEEAKNKSLNIIKEGNERAKRMIKETDLELDESKDFVQAQLRGAAEEFKSDVLKEASEFGETLHKETVQTEQELKDKLAAEFQKAQVEITSYKQGRLKEIDQKSLAVIEDIVKEFFSKTLTTDDHVELIKQLLEKHKKPFELEA